MSDVILPNMGLVVPTPTSATQAGTPGPLYAQEVSNNYPTIDGHTHTGAANLDGKQLTQASLNLTGDLPLNANNLTSVRSTRYVNQSGVLNGAGDINCVYVDGGELYFNEANGTPVKITSNGILNFTVPANYSVKTVTNTNYTILSTDPFTAIEVSTTTTPVTVTLPVAATVTSGRFYVIKDIGGAAGTNAITIQVAGASGNVIDGAGGAGTSLSILTNWGYVLLFTDATLNWYIVQASFVHHQQGMDFQNGSSCFFRTGATLDLEGPVTGAPAITWNNALISLANGTFGFNSVSVGVSGTAAWVWTGSAALNMTSGGNGINMSGGSSLLFNQSFMAFSGGSGTAQWNTGTTLTMSSGAIFTINPGVVVSMGINGTSSVALSGTATMAFSASATMSFAGVSSGLTFNGGAFLTFNGTSALDMNGAIYTSVEATRTANYTMDSGTNPDKVIQCNATGGGFTVTLSSANSCTGRSVTIKKTISSGNTVTVATAGGNIDGVATQALIGNQVAITVWSDGTNWWVISSH